MTEPYKVSNEVQHVEKIAGHRVVPVLSRMTTEARWPAFEISLHWEQNAFFIEQEGRIVAALSYSKQEHRSELFINAVYVLPRFRRRGHYRQMFDALVERAKRDKMRRVSGIVAFDNQVMREVAQRVGRRPECVTLTLDLPDRTGAPSEYGEDLCTGCAMLEGDCLCDEDDDQHI